MNTTGDEPSPPLETEALEKRLELLQGISIFFTLPDSDLRRLARKLRLHHARAGATIIRQGDLSDHIFIIESGRCEVRTQWAPGHGVTVALLSEGDFFGISALTPGHKQDASIVATEACELLELDREAIDAVLVEGSSARKELARLVEQRHQSVKQVVNRAQTVSPEQHGMVIAIYSIKGGSGKTTLAVNLGAALGAKYRGECVVLDLGLPYNHAALVANLVPTGCLAMLQHLPENRFEEAVLSKCLHHPSGALVLPSSLKVEQSELITPHLVQGALDVLETNFSFVVVDLGISMTEVTLGVLERASRVLMIVTPELPTLKDTQEVLRVFDTVLKIPSGSISLVLNHPRPRGMVSRSDAERVIGRDMDFEIEHDGAHFERAAVTGDLLVVSSPTSSPARMIQRLAGGITEDFRVLAKR